jgi:anti-anti-sigma factor
MNLSFTREVPLLIGTLAGRLDAFGAGEFQKALAAEFTAGLTHLVLDLNEVAYLSSAGVRALLLAAKQADDHGGSLALARLQPYCREVLETTGFAETFPTYPSLEEARAACGRTGTRLPWSKAEPAETEAGRFRFRRLREGPAAARVAGDVKDVLHARVTPAQLHAKRFFETEYSIGLGALGAKTEDFFPILGEMITVGGTMVWLPTDGHDTPDFLIPRKDRDAVMIRTAFNVSLAGGFHEEALFESAAPEGATMAELYRALFALARTRRPDFKGILGLALRAQMPAVFGSGVRKAPIADLAPVNGKMITHASNLAEWFDADAIPRHRNVTGLIVGCGADLTADLSDYDEEQLNRIFYLNPTNVGSRDQLLHNHVALFSEQPFHPEPESLEQEIRAVVQAGDFLDMRHLQDNSRVTRALLGLLYVQTIEPDASAAPLADEAAPCPASAADRKKIEQYRSLQKP